MNETRKSHPGRGEGHGEKHGPAGVGGGGEEPNKKKKHPPRALTHPEKKNKLRM